MKKISLILLLAAASISLSAQQRLEAQEVLSFFEKNGTVRMETEELDAAADTLVVVQHRKDDVVWSRMVYRIIDMRYKQNYQLYFPTDPYDSQYMSLWRLIMQAVKEGVPIYRKKGADVFKPEFHDSLLVARDQVSDYFLVGSIADMNRDDPDTYLMPYDSVNDVFNLNFTRYESYIRNQLKFVIQEVIFFDRHTSRLHRQIISIAPMQPDMAEQGSPMRFLTTSIRFWILYQDLRPYLAKNYMIPFQNETKRVTFDEYFQKRLYTSYLIGEGNMYNRMILEYAKTMEEAQKEQARIENELLTFEQDLWEY